MDVLLYYFSNILATVAALLLLKVYAFGPSAKNGKYTALLISRDLEVMVFTSSIARAYWSFSPPPVWNSDPFWIQCIAMIDTVTAIGLWGVILWVGRSQKRAVPEIRWYLRAPTLLAASTGIALVGQFFVDERPSEGSWRFAAFMVMFNMSLDTLAMMPQMHTIQHAEDGASNETCHFVGLLAFARLLRMLFWGISLVQQYFYAQWASMCWAGSGRYRKDPQNPHRIFAVRDFLLALFVLSVCMWPFIIPDIVHTVIMGEYLWLWAQKIRRDSVDMLNEGLEGLMTIV